MREAVDIQVAIMGRNPVILLYPNRPLEATTRYGDKARQLANGVEYSVVVFSKYFFSFYYLNHLKYLLHITDDVIAFHRQSNNVFSIRSFRTSSP